MGENGPVERNLFSGARLPLDDGLCCLVVLVRHGAGEGGHSLTVTDVEADVRVGNEELDDDAVLVADGNVDGCSAFSILAEDKERTLRQKHQGPTPRVVDASRSSRGRQTMLQRDHWPPKQNLPDSSTV